RGPVGQGPGVVVELLGIAVEGSDRIDVSALPIAFCPEIPRLLGGGPSGSELLRSGTRPDGMVVGHGDAPVGHSAGRVLLRDALEGPSRLLVTEGMQECDGARELLSDVRTAGGGEIYCSELFQLAVRVVVLLSKCAGGAERECDSDDTPDS